MDRLQILLVDDDVEILKLQELYLRSCGHEVACVETPREALRALGEQSFDLVVLDFDLGAGQTGLKLFDQMRAQGHDVPAIMLTGMTGDEAVVGALRAGLRDFVRKGDGFLNGLGAAIPRVMAQVEAERAKRDAFASELREQAAKAESSRVLDRVAEGLSHNLNNMLSSVIGFSEIELRRLDESSPTRKALERILNGGLRAAAVVKQLSAASQRHPVRPTPLSLGAHMRQVDSVLRVVNRPEIHVEVITAPDLAFVEADAEHVDQILYNLTIRACDAMKAGGTLRISAENHDVPPSPPPPPGATPAGRWVKLLVQDSGPPLDEQALRHAFEPFRELRAERHGSGLELAAAHGFVLLNGGHIEVRAGTPSGTAIEVHFPRA